MIKIKLRSAAEETFELKYGWYSFAGNRNTLGWYLTNLRTREIRPLYDIDLEDVFMWSDSESWNQDSNEVYRMINHYHR